MSVINSARRNTLALALALTLTSTVGGPSLAQPPDPHGDHSKTDFLVQRLDRAGVDESLEGLLTAVQSHDNPSIRSIAAMVLGERGETRSLPVLLGVSRNDADPEVRLIATDALCRMVRDDECLAILTQGFEAAVPPADPLPWACRLAQQGDARGLPLFRQRLADPETQRAALGSLACFLGLEAPGFAPRQLLLDHLRSDDPEIRALAVNQSTLGLLRGVLTLAEIEPILETLTRDDDRSIRRQAEAALLHGRQLAEASPNPEPLPQSPSNPDVNDPSDEDLR